MRNRTDRMRFGRVVEKSGLGLGARREREEELGLSNEMRCEGKNRESAGGDSG